MHSIKGIFKHKSKSEGFLLNDSSISDEEGKENKKKLKENKKNENRKSNNSILKNLSRHSSRISNIGLENESTDILKEKAITNDVNLLNNDVNGNNIPNENVDSKDHKILHKELPTIRTLQKIGASTSMPVISPSRKEPGFSEDEEQIARQKSKKELKKEFKIEEKKKKKELNKQKKKEKKERKMQKNLEKGEFYALNGDKKRKEIKKEYKKMKKNKNSVFDMNKSSESLNPSSNININSLRNLDDSENKKDNDKKKIKDNNENENDENYENSKVKGKEIEEEEKEEVDGNKEMIREKESGKIDKEELKEKLNENKENENKENENKENVNKENENKENENKENENKENVNKENENKENENKNEKNEGLNVLDEKKKQEIEKIEDDLPLAILRYKNPQTDEFNRMKNINNIEDEDEDKPLYEVKLRYSNRRSMLNGNEMRKSVSASDLLIRVRRSMALRNSTYFNTGDSTNINRANIPKVQSFNVLQPISNDDEDELSLAAIKQKRASVLNPTAEPNNNNHTIYSNNRNTYSNSAMKNSFSTGCLNINKPTIHNSLMVGQMNGMMMNGAPINNSPLNGIPITGMVKNGVPINSSPMNGSPLNTVSFNNMLRASPGHSPINSPLLRSNEAGRKRSSVMSNNGIKNSRSSMSFAEYNKLHNEQELQRKRQSIIESNKRRSQIMMNNYIPNDRMKKGGSSNSIESGNSSSSSHKKLNSNEKLNKPGNGCGKIYENEIQEYPGQKFITFTPLEFNTFPATASVRVIPGQSKRDKVQRRSLAIEVQAPKETFIPIETKDHNYMQIESLRYKKQKRKEHQEYEDKIASWVNDSVIPPQSSQTKKI